MFPLTKQVQIATDHAGLCCAARRRTDRSANEDTEDHAFAVWRGSKVLSIVESFKPEQLDGSRRAEITIKFRT